MMHVTEVEKAQEVLEAIEIAESLLRSAGADIRLRCHYEPDTDDHQVLTESLHKHLALAKVAVAQAQSAEDLA